MLIPADDLPIHQTAQPLAYSGGGHPDFYDRFWFNGYTEDFFFALGLGSYPNRGVLDAGFSVVHDGVQRSTFASRRAAHDRTLTDLGSIRVEIVEPMRSSRLIIDAPEHGLGADLTFTARTAALEEPRQTRYQDVRLMMDVTRATQLGSWSGTITTGADTLTITDAAVRGTKDRSWGVRSVGDPAPMAPLASARQFFFLWAPLNFDDVCFHDLTFDDAEGRAWAGGSMIAPVLVDGQPTTGPGAPVAEHLDDVERMVRWAPGLRRSNGATISFRRPSTGERESIELEPLLTFRMHGVGYSHPRFAHGRWHDEEVTGGEEHRVEDLDNLELHNIHIQQVMRATWGARTGLGVLEQLAVGPHRPTGLTGILDGFAG